MEHIWQTLDSYDGQRSLKQHAFIPKEHRRKWTDEKYIANKIVCGGGGVIDDGEELMSWEEVLKSSESINDNCCKKCKKFLDRRE